jgi:hypothetical protein
MRYLTHTAASYVGIDLHARTLFVCVIDNAGVVKLAKNLPAKPEPFLHAITPFRPDLIVGCECMQPGTARRHCRTNRSLRSDTPSA